MTRRTVLTILAGAALLCEGGVVSGKHGTALGAEAPRQTVKYVPPVIRVFPVATVNSTQLFSFASVKVASGLVASEDRLHLEYYGAANITVSYDQTTGTLTLRGAAAGTEWANILKSVRYKNAAGRPKSGDRVVLAQIGSGTTSTSYYDRFSTTIQVVDQQ